MYVLHLLFIFDSLILVNCYRLFVILVLIPIDKYPDGILITH